MTKSLPILLVSIGIAISGYSQKTPAAPSAVQAFGKIDNADLEMKACDFEKDANAEVLFDKGDIYFDSQFNITMDYQKRIKIFNDNGKKEANIRIEFFSNNNYEFITGLQAETINLVNGKPEYTKLDKKLLYTEKVDKNRSAYVFSFPDVKPGSVIEYKYKWTTNDIDNFPSWYFQSHLPVRYSELDTEVPDFFTYKTQSHIRDQFVLNTNSTEGRNLGSGTDSYGYQLLNDKRALANLHSLPDEPYMTSDNDNLQSVFFQLTYIKAISGFDKSYADSWSKIAAALNDHEDFGAQFKKKLANEDAVVNKAKALHTDQEKISYVFNEVRDDMKWDGTDDWYTNDGTVKAWDKKSGNSSEVNLVLYHLLKQAGVKSYPMLVSTRDHGKVNPAYPFIYQFNRTVVYIPVDSARHYILDATGKYNTYNETPNNLLNSSGLWVDKDNKAYDMVFITKTAPAIQLISVIANITPAGKLTGTAQLNSYSYNRINSIKKYKTDGEEKYIDYLRNNDNSLKISALKMVNMETDTLPLTQNMEFNQELTGSDGTYIYFKPAMFIPGHVNPFLAESRFSDIDFGYRDNYALSGSYKIPEGYKTDAIPKSITMQMPDQSIVFKRVIAEQDGAVMVRYTIDYKKTIFFKENYLDLFEFYKKMHEMMDEQVVLKKS